MGISVWAGLRARKDPSQSRQAAMLWTHSHTGTCLSQGRICHSGRHPMDSRRACLSRYPTLLEDPA